jgi:predicted PurR-regulated permease PerM
MLGGDRKPFSSNTLIAVAALVIAIAGLKAARSLLVPGVFAAFVAIIGTPTIHWLRRHRVPAAIAVIVVLVALSGALTSFGVLIGSSIDSFGGAIGDYRERFQQLSDSVASWLQARGLRVSGLPLLEVLDPGVMMDLVARIFQGLMAALSNAFLVLVLLLFLFIETTSLRAKLASALGGEEQLQRFQGLFLQIQRYLGVKTLMGLITGLVLGIWAAVIGVDFPWLWGLLAFLLNYIPFIGQVMAAAPPVLLALVQLGPGRTAVLAAGYLVVNLVLTSLEPLWMGRRLSLSPLVVFLSLGFWNFVWGPVGMLLAVPLTVIIKLLLEQSDDLRWVAVLMDVRATDSEQG